MVFGKFNLRERGIVNYEDLVLYIPLCGWNYRQTIQIYIMQIIIGTNTLLYLFYFYQANTFKKERMKDSKHHLYISIQMLINFLNLVSIIVYCFSFSLKSKYTYPLLMLFNSITFLVLYPFSFLMNVKQSNKGPMYQSSALYMSILEDPLICECLSQYMDDIGKGHILTLWNDLHQFTIAASSRRYQFKDISQCAELIFINYFLDFNPQLYPIPIEKVYLINKKSHSKNDVYTAYDDVYQDLTSLILDRYCGPFSMSVYSSHARSLLSWFSTFDNLTNELKSSIQKNLSKITIAPPKSICSRCTRTSSKKVQSIFNNFSFDRSGNATDSVTSNTKTVQIGNVATFYKPTQLNNNSSIPYSAYTEVNANYPIADGSLDTKSSKRDSNLPPSADKD